MRRNEPSRCRSSSAAFTLIELLVVCAIIGILAAMMLAKFHRALLQARAAQSIANMKAVQAAIDIRAATSGETCLPVLTGGMYADGCGANYKQMSGGIDLCASWKTYIDAIPPNTLNTNPGNGKTFVWNSVQEALDDWWETAAWQQYPSGADQGYFFARRYLMVMLNNVGTHEDGRFYYELGQGWSANGVAYGNPGFGGPWY